MEELAAGLELAFGVLKLANRSDTGFVQDADTIGLAEAASFEMMVEQRIQIRQAATDSLKEAIASLRRICPHQRVVEAPYEPSASGFFNALDRHRLCLVCRIEEQPHGLAFTVLRAQPERVVKHSELYALRFPIAMLEVKEDPACHRVFDITSLDDRHHCPSCASEKKEGLKVQ